MHKEMKNYYRRCISPVFFVNALLSLAWRTYLAIFRRIIPNYRALMLPKNISKLRKLVLKNNILISEISSCSHQSSGRLKLTNAWLDYDITPDWFVEFEDQEVTNSLHRWNWLLNGLSEENIYKLSREEGISLIRSWLRCCLSLQRFNNDAYSSSERIVNASIFLLTTGDKTVPQDIQNAFQYMATQIAKNLEYYEEDMTGNHAFNNARGLLFAGIVSKLPFATELAFEIFKERLPKLVTDDGFLREGSSHYHFLFTRWVLEIVWILSSSKNKDVESIIRPYAINLVKRCWFFLVKNSKTEQWSIPLIGDISPDFPPEWLLSVPWSLPALDVFMPDSLPSFEGKKGWGSLFGIDNGSGEAKIVGIETYPDSYWHRIDFNQMTFFSHAEGSSGKLRSDHRHLDLGGFILYYAGQPLLIDCGRLDYTQSDASVYGYSASSHNTLLINGLSAEVDGPSWLQEAYKRVRVKTKLTESEDSVMFTINHDGFDRISNRTVAHERRFKLKSDMFEIEDRLLGHGTCDLGLSFHYSPEFGPPDSQGSEFSFKNIGATFHVDNRFTGRVLSGQSESPISGLFSTEYGVIANCFTLDIHETIHLPAIIKNRVSFNA